MLDQENIIVDYIEAPQGNKGIVFQVAHEVYLKMVDYLRLTQAKNTFNRLSDYHYLNIAVSNSTEPIRGIDYIHPVVTPGVDYATAIITKCLMPNGRVNFEFERFSESDTEQSNQATEMVKYMLNSKNDSYQIIRDWAQDSLLHKNGIVMVSPVRAPITQYKEVEGTKDQLRVFETLAGEKGLTAKRQEMRKIDVDLQGVMQESPDMNDAEKIQSSLSAHTIYRAKYKLTGYSTTVKVKHVAQHYFVCNPTISNIQDQDFVGFYDPMTIHECKAQFPYVDLEKLAKHAAFGPAGAYQAGALENDLALHARDSTPVPGQGVVASAGWLQGISNLFSSGAAKVGGSTTAVGGDSLSTMAAFVNSNFSTLYAWLGAALKPLLTQQGGQGLTIAPSLPGVPTFSGTSSSTAAGPGSPADAAAVQTFFASQFGSLLNGPNSIAGKVQALTDLTASRMDSLIGAMKLAVAPPPGTAALSFAGAQATSGAGSPNTFHFHNPRITNQNEASALLDQAVTELRRRGRAIG